jgi:Porin subfamily
MLNAFRFMTIAPGNGQSAYRRTLALSLATTACLMLPGIAGQAFAADITRSGPARVSTDSSVICTFWMGPGMETPFYITDGDGKPLPANQYASLSTYNKFDAFLDRLDGLLWASTPAAKAWLKTEDGQAWSNSEEGRKWVDEYVKGAPAARGIEYVKICSAYGAGYYYVPGTDVCLKLGGYLRTEGKQKDKEPEKPVVSWDDLQKALDTQAAQSQSKPDKTDWIEEAAKTYEETLKAQKAQPAQGSPSQGASSQTPATPQTTTTSPTTTSPATADQAKGGDLINVTIFIKGHVPEGVVAPPVKEQNIKLTFTMPDVDFSKPRTEQQVNSGASYGAPQGKTGVDGKVTVPIMKDDLKNYGLGYGLKDDWKIAPKLDYKLTGSLTVQNHGGYYSTEPYNNDPPKKTTGLIGTDYQWGTYMVGDQKYLRVDYGTDFNVNYKDEQLKQDITDVIKYELGKDVRVVFEGDICRVELPGPWVPNYTPVAMKPGEGLPQATIKLNTASRRRGGAL